MYVSAWCGVLNYGSMNEYSDIYMYVHCMYMYMYMYLTHKKITFTKKRIQ